MKRTSALFLLAALATLAFFAACGPRERTGPVDVRWDRDACERCRMAVSDHYYSAQVRGGPAGKSTQVWFFDDLGCAVLWLAEQDWKDDPRVEMWVNEHDTGDWIDAFKCVYLPGRITPMDFGLGALAAGREQPGDGAIDYAAAVEHIERRMIEKKKKRDAANAASQAPAPKDAP